MSTSTVKDQPDRGASGEKKIPRQKLWHESKHLRKRAAFLLDDIDLIPTDVTFRVGKEKDVSDIDGHKIFFGLVSPVFHAMLFGDLKEQNIVNIPDVTPSAFRCLKTYAYSDSFDHIIVDNVMDVLAASKKYMINKLTRYCYEFVQNKITVETAVSFWSKARVIADSIVEKQSIAEIKRSAAKIVFSEDFMDLPESQLIELTSWNELNIREPDLYSALKKWRTHQQPSRPLSEPIKKRRKDDGILQHIRFALFTPKELASGPVMVPVAATQINLSVKTASIGKDGVFSADEMQELYLHAFGTKQMTTFKPNIRTAYATFHVSIRTFATNVQNGYAEDMEWKFFDTLELQIWADVAPVACQLLREIVENNNRLRLEVTVDSGKDSLWIERKKSGCCSYKFFGNSPNRLAERGASMERTSELWPAPGSVCFRFDGDGVPSLTVFNENPLVLGGKDAGSTFGTACKYGIVVGKVLKGPGEHLLKMATYSYAACNGFHLENEDERRPWVESGSQEFAFFQSFECDLVNKS